MHSWICVSVKKYPINYNTETSRNICKESTGLLNTVQQSIDRALTLTERDCTSLSPHIIPWYYWQATSTLKCCCFWTTPLQASCFSRSDCAVSIERARKGENISVVHESNYGNGCQKCRAAGSNRQLSGKSTCRLRVVQFLNWETT